MILYNNYIKENMHINMYIKLNEKQFREDITLKENIVFQELRVCN